MQKVGKVGFGKFNFLGKKGDGFAYSGASRLGKVACHTSIMFKSWSHIPSQFPVEVPRFSLGGMHMCNDSCSWWGQWRLLKLNSPNKNAQADNFGLLRLDCSRFKVRLACGKRQSHLDNGKSGLHDTSPALK